MIKGYRIRLYPTKEQEEIIWKHIHASRFIWNYMLAMQNENYKNGIKYLDAYKMSGILTIIKQQPEYLWLYEVSNKMLQRTCADLADAYKNFFRGGKHPKFKSRKKAKAAFPASSESFYFKNGRVNLEKIGKVKYKTDFTFSEGRGYKYLNVRVSAEDGKYYVSFAIEHEKQVKQLTNCSMGIDLGVKELAVVSFEDNMIVYHNINKSGKIRKINKQIKYIQRRISHKYEESKKRTGRYEKTNNIVKLEKELRRLLKRKTNIRQNYIHQVTHALVCLNPCRVVMEDLNVTGMMKNKHLSKAIQEQCFYEFIRQMRYKCEWNGINFVQADRFYPSSKTCSNCGAVKKSLKLGDRVYICSECGLKIDRDYNAAINLMRYVV